MDMLILSTGSSYGFSKDHYWQIMLSDIQSALQVSGVESEFVDVADHNSFLSRIMTIYQNPSLHPGFTLNFNLLESFELSAMGQTRRVPELFMARPICLFLDHPAHIAERVADFLPRTYLHDLRPGVPLPAIWGVMDRSHYRILNDLGIGADRIFLWGQAGPQSLLPPMHERDIDVLFCGTLTVPPSDDAFLSGIPHESAIREAVARAVTVALENQDPYESIRQDWLSAGRKFDVLSIANLAKLADLRARSIRRYRQVHSFKTLAIHFCGNIDASVPTDFPRSVFHGPLSFGDVRGLMARSRILLSDTINLNDSMLMRAHYAMAHGCVVATDANDFIGEQFTHLKDMIILDDVVADVDVLTSILSDTSKLADISRQAFQTQQSHHQWANRLGPLLAAMQA